MSLCTRWRAQKASSSVLEMADAPRSRLAFLLETVALEAEHLLATDQRLFAQAFTAERAASLRYDPMLVAFVQACAAYAASRKLV